jgi:quinol monooxygenase YgiN
MLTTLCALLLAVPALNSQDKAKTVAGPMIGHMVYFKLKDATADNKKKLVDACKKYLADHDGVVFFSAGVLCDSLKRDVNDRDWDVALHLVFTDKAAHDKYQDHPEHLKFIEENKALWAKVRVFDSEFTDYKTGKKKEK